MGVSRRQTVWNVTCVPSAFVAVTDLPALLECALRRGGDDFALVFKLLNRLRKARGCALVFAAIHGADGKDPTARTVPFAWDGDRGLEGLRVGYLAEGFGREPEGDDEEERDESRQQIALEEAALAAVRGDAIGTLVS